MPFFENLKQIDLVILLVITVFMVVYVCLIFYFFSQLIKGKQFHFQKKVKDNNSNPLPFISVVVAFRNEDENLPKLLDCLVVQDYPADKFEILLSDDHSTDDSNAIVQDYANRYEHIHLILLKPLKERQKTGKKNALFRAIEHSRGEVILATDADCKMGKYWVKSIGSFFSEHPSTKMLLAPVDIISEKGSLFSRLQSLEFMSLTGSTAGSAMAGKPIMCNGANLAFLRRTYLSLQGCMPGGQFASGDDIFLLQCIQHNFPGSVFFLQNEEAIVKTKPVNSLRQFILQRVRWSSKTTGYTNRFTIFAGATVAVLNLTLAALMLYVPFRAEKLFFPVFMLFLIKLLVDFLLILPVSRFLNKTNLLLYMPALSFVYPFYVSFVLLLSLFHRGKWKERRI
ncbi:MAG: glycosyltransferase [Bacteroidales bacterium]